MSEPRFESWGAARAKGARAIDPAAPFERAAPGSVLPFGNGRSYGDTCLLSGGGMLRSRDAARILSFDPATGVLEAEAGVLLSEITRRVAPDGWFLPVTPGTQFVTLGGAIANDVHGKNHHRRGTFGRCVSGFALERSDYAGILDCAPDRNAALFAATIGGMGLTGLIRRATIRLMRVPSTAIQQRTRRFERLADYFDLAEEADARHEYAVAWIDSIAGGDALGRGHLICGDHAEGGARAGIARPPLFTVPFRPPVSPLSGPPLRAFNAAYFRRAPRGTSEADVPFDTFFYPLDRIGRWNRLYGPRGLHQHQSVVPFAGGEDAVRALIECARAHRHGSFLTVLKRFGEVASPGLLSFPMPGYTLTLDFPDRGPRTRALLAELDGIAIAAGGRVNPYKDARMSAQTFAASFPNWRNLEAMRDPAIVSDFWRRTALRLSAPAAAPAGPTAATVSLPFAAKAARLNAACGAVR